jgi:TetR/AcrR family transcriptional regulator, lmrAB and yxaGH operons repressor
VSVRDRLIISTIDLMRRHGVAGTGIAAILEHGNASRRSIYMNFPDGKTGLVREATHVAGAFIEQQIATALESPTPQEALAVFIAGWKKVVADSDFTAGCPIAAAGSARSLEPHTADAAGETFARWQAAIGNSLHHHGMSESAAAALATTAIAAVEGGVLLAVAQRSLDPLDDVQGQLELLIDVHLSPTDARRTGRRR